MASKQPHRTVRSEGGYRSEFIDELFTAMLNQRLNELARKPEASFLAAAVGRQPILRPIDVWFQGAVVKNERTEDTLTAVAAELGRVARFGFTETEIARAKQALIHTREVGAKERDRTESKSYVQQLVRVFLTGESVPGIEAELALAQKLVPAITADEIRAVAARAASPQNRVVIKPLVLAYLGGLPAGNAERWRDIKVEHPRGAVTVDVAQGVEPRASVKLLFHQRATWSLQAAHDLAALAAALSIRLREELREGMSGTYGVAVASSFVREPRPEGTIEIAFDCAPEAMEPLIARTREVVAAFKHDGPPSDVVDKIKQTERRERETNLKTNQFWLDELVESYRLGDDARHALLDKKRLIEGLSVARLKSAANRYLGKNEILGVLRPAAMQP